MNKVEEFAQRVRRLSRWKPAHFLQLFKAVPMELRLAAKEDIPLLVELRINFLMIDVQPVNALKEGLLALSLANYFLRHLEAGDLLCWVMTAEGKIVGGACIVFNHYPPAFDGMEEETAQLINLHTLPGYRDEALEQQLFARLFEEAAKRNVSVVKVQDGEARTGGNSGFAGFKG